MTLPKVLCHPYHAQTLPPLFRTSTYLPGLGLQISRKSQLQPTMEAEPSLEIEGHLTCACGRSFTQQSALSKHQKSCQRSKKRLSVALDKAKSAWSEKKRRRLDPSHEHIALNIQPSSAGLTPLSSRVDEHVDYEVSSNILLTELLAVIMPFLLAHGCRRHRTG